MEDVQKKIISELGKNNMYTPIVGKIILQLWGKATQAIPSPEDGFRGHFIISFMSHLTDESICLHNPSWLKPAKSGARNEKVMLT